VSESIPQLQKSGAKSKSGINNICTTSIETGYTFQRIFPISLTLPSHHLCHAWAFKTRCVSRYINHKIACTILSTKVLLLSLILTKNCLHKERRKLLSPVSALKSCYLRFKKKSTLIKRKSSPVNNVVMTMTAISPTARRAPPAMPQNSFSDALWCLRSNGDDSFPYITQKPLSRFSWDCKGCTDGVRSPVQITHGPSEHFHKHSVVH
jgi:hypothetical protein